MLKVCGEPTQVSHTLTICDGAGGGGGSIGGKCGGGAEGGDMMRSRRIESLPCTVSLPPPPTLRDGRVVDIPGAITLM